MINKNVLLTLIVMISACAQTNALTLFELNVRAQVGITTCTGAYSTCTQTINAIGQPLTIDIRNYTVSDLGQIKGTLSSKVIKVPTIADQLIVYAFTPTQGELANQRMFIVFYNQKQALGSRLAGKNVVKIYRRLATEPINKWIETGYFVSATPFDSMPFDIKPDGVWSTIDPTTNQPVDINFGKAQLT